MIEKPNVRVWINTLVPLLSLLAVVLLSLLAVVLLFAGKLPATIDRWKSNEGRITAVELDARSSAQIQESTLKMVEEQTALIRGLLLDARENGVRVGATEKRLDEIADRHRYEDRRSPANGEG